MSIHKKKIKKLKKSKTKWKYNITKSMWHNSSSPKRE